MGDAEDIKKLEGKLAALEGDVSGWIDKLTKQTGTQLIKAKDYIDKIHKDDDAKADQTAKNVQTLVKKFNEIDAQFKTFGTQIKANTADTEGNRQALIRAKKYVDDHDSVTGKKIDGLKKVMDEMEKRHVKLIDTSIKNYDRLIRKVIEQAVAKGGKGRR